MDRVSSVSPSEAAALINHTFQDYTIVINETGTGFVNRCANNDLDLSRSPLLYVDGEPAGLALLGIRGRRGWLGGMGVKREHRGLGLGRMLLEDIAAEARKAGLETLTLEVIEENTSAIGLYRMAGFQERRILHCLRRSGIGHGHGSGGAGGILEDLRPVQLSDLADIYDSRNCWQKSLATISRVEGLEAYALNCRDAARGRLHQGYTVLSRRNHKAEVLDAQPSEALPDILSRFCNDVMETRAVNVHDPGLVEKYIQEGFTTFLRQKEMVLDMDTTRL